MQGGGAGAGVDRAAKGAAVLGAACSLLATCWLPPGFEAITKKSLGEYVAEPMASRGGPEKDDDGVTFRTSNWRLGPNLILHVLPDCAIYYGFLFFLVALGLASHNFPRSVGAALKRRVLLLEDTPPAKWWWTWIGAPPWSASVGGLVVAAAFIVTLGLFIRY